MGVNVLSEAGSVPLAVRRDRPRPQASQLLTAGATVMLLTDGLVERHGESIDHGIARVADILLDTIDAPVDAVADALLHDLVPDHGYDDDVAFVVCRPVPSPLRIDAVATADRLRELRHRLGEWLRAAAVPDEVAANIVLAANEACSNCIEHAYAQGDSGTMHLEADRNGDEIQVRVRDFGSWKTPAADPGSRGHGLPLIQSLSEHGRVDGTVDGTTVHMRFESALPTPMCALSTADGH
jgi:anti-sigma regulatory factor (Ser/Thr protein kinase)